MISTWIMKAFLVGYVICAGVCLLEARYVLGMYWIGGAILTFAVVLMGE